MKVRVWLVAVAALGLALVPSGASSTPSCLGRTPTIVDGPASSNLHGGPGTDVIFAGAGNDTVAAGDGVDYRVRRRWRRHDGRRHRR